MCAWDNKEGGGGGGDSLHAVELPEFQLMPKDEKFVLHSNATMCCESLRCAVSGRD